MGDFVDGEVFADGGLGRLPHEGALGGIKLDKEGAVTLRGSIGRPVGNGFVQPSGGWVDLGG